MMRASDWVWYALNQHWSSHNYTTKHFIDSTENDWCPLWYSRKLCGPSVILEEPFGLWVLALCTPTSHQYCHRPQRHCLMQTALKDSRLTRFCLRWLMVAAGPYIIKVAAAKPPSSPTLILTGGLTLPRKSILLWPQHLGRAPLPVVLLAVHVRLVQARDNKVHGVWSIAWGQELQKGSMAGCGTCKFRDWSKCQQWLGVMETRERWEVSFNICHAIGWIGAYWDWCFRPQASHLDVLKLSQNKFRVSDFWFQLRGNRIIGSALCSAGVERGFLMRPGHASSFCHSMISTKHPLQCKLLIFCDFNWRAITHERLFSDCWPQSWNLSRTPSAICIQYIMFPLVLRSAQASIAMTSFRVIFFPALELQPIVLILTLCYYTLRHSSHSKTSSMNLFQPWICPIFVTELKWLYSPQNCWITLSLRHNPLCQDG